MILHIPHSSTEIPEGYSVTPTQVDLNTLTDHFTDELFFYEYSEIMVFPWSRFFCDVERFNSEDEPMNAKGHGVVYAKGTDNNTIRINLDDSKNIIDKFYIPWHKALKKNINKQLTLFDNVVIVDCHSFEETNPSADFCIGLNKNNIPPFIDEIINLIQVEGYTVSINDPFTGSMIPNEFISHPNVFTFMLEVNKKIYITDYLKNDNFINIKNIINSIMSEINDYEHRGTNDI